MVGARDSATTLGLMTTAAVEAKGLIKRFGDFSAVNALDMTIPRGSFYAFLGPNGAGKSTTISLLTGISAPDAGSLTLLGIDAAKDPLAVKSRVGVVPEELSLFERLTGRQYLTFCGRMHGLSGDESERRADELLTLTELSYKGGALVAEKLILCTGAQGILERLDDPQSLISYTDVAGLRRLREVLVAKARDLSGEAPPGRTHPGRTHPGRTHP